MGGGRVAHSHIGWVRVTNLVLRLYVCPPIQEEGDGGMVTIDSSQMEGGPSILQRGHTDRQADSVWSRTRTKMCILVFKWSMRGGRVAHSHIGWVRVTNLVLRLYACPPIQEEGDGGILTLGRSPMEGG